MKFLQLRNKYPMLRKRQNFFGTKTKTGLKVSLVVLN